MRTSWPSLGMIATGLLMLAAPVVLAQQPPPKAPMDDPADYRRLFRKPTTPAEYWEALQFEIDVGRYDLAARHLSGLVNFKDLKDDDLLKIHDRVGMASFLRLRLVTKWVDGKDKDATTRNAQAFKDVETLITRVSNAVHVKLNDPKRISDFVKNLNAGQEEYEYSVRELYRSGAAVMPSMIDEIRATQGRRRQPLLRALTELNIDTVPPLLAALDIDDAELRVDLLWALRNRKDFVLLPQKGIDPTPFLWPLASPIEKSDLVRKQAREAISKLLGIGEDNLPLAKDMLTRQAERCYQHKMKLPDPLIVWRWDAKANKLLEDKTFTVSTAEEYYGLRFARQALAIEPAYRPAQLVFLGLIVDKGFIKPTPEAPLGTLKPTASELLGSVDPDLVHAMLERALAEKKTPVIIEATRTLGNLAEKRSNRPTMKGQPALVRALSYGDRRVEMAAADALLRIPGPPAEKSQARIVEIFARALTPDAAARTRQRIIIASANADLRTPVARAADAAGMDTIEVNSGRDLLRRLNASSDIDALIIDSKLPDPGLSSLLAQLSADASARRLPILLAAMPEGNEARLILEQLEAVMEEIKAIAAAPQRKAVSNPFLQNEVVQKDLGVGEDRFDVARKERLAELQKKRLLIEGRYALEARAREASLERFVVAYPQVRVMPAVLLTDPKEMQARLEELQQQTNTQPLSKAEQKEHAERALYWLSRMARGELLGDDQRPAYDVKPAVKAIMDALPGLQVSNEAVSDALRVLGRSKEARAETELITVTLDAQRPVPVRVVAAEELARHIQEFGRPAAGQAKILLDGVQAQLRGMVDPTLRPKLITLVGALRPDAPTTGERLKGFTP